MLTRRESFQLELDLLSQWEFEYGDKASPDERLARQLRRDEIRKALRGIHSVKTVKDGLGDLDYLVAGLRPAFACS